MEEDSVVITQGWVLNNHAIQINEDTYAGKTQALFMICYTHVVHKRNITINTISVTWLNLRLGHT